MRVCLLQRNAHIRRWFLARYAPHDTTVAASLLLPVSLAIAPGALVPRRRIAEKPPSALWDRSLPSCRADPSVGCSSQPSLRQGQRVAGHVAVGAFQTCVGVEFFLRSRVGQIECPCVTLEHLCPCGHQLRELRRKDSVCRESLTTGWSIVVFHLLHVCPQSH